MTIADGFDSHPFFLRNLQYSKNRVYYNYMKYLLISILCVIAAVSVLSFLKRK